MKQRKWIFAGMLLSILSLGITGCDKRPDKLVSTGTAMGTVVQETLYVTDIEQGKKTSKEILSLVESLEKGSLSWRESDAELAQINLLAGTKEGILLTEQMQTDLQQIWKISEASKGALDVTIGGVTRLWDLDTWAVADTQALEQFQEPGAILLQEALNNSGYSKVLIQKGRMYLPEGMCLDLGAVGKGIACNRIREYLAGSEEITGAVISVGGSIVTYGSKTDGSLWQVAIMHPRKEGAYLGVLSLEGEWCVSTSGDYERYVEKDGIRYHHIIDPLSGYPVNNELCSVTILCRDGLLSDALSTACFVLGAEEGMKLAQEFQVEALFVTKDLEVIMTDGMAQYFTVA